MRSPLPPRQASIVLDSYWRTATWELLSDYSIQHKLLGVMYRKSFSIIYYCHWLLLGLRPHNFFSQRKTPATQPFKQHGSSHSTSWHQFCCTTTCVSTSPINAIWSLPTTFSFSILWSRQCGESHAMGQTSRFAATGSCPATKSNCASEAYVRASHYSLASVLQSRSWSWGGEFVSAHREIWQGRISNHWPANW